MDAERILIKARIDLLLKEPFWGTLAKLLTLQEAPESLGVDIAGTDGENLFYNPAGVYDLYETQGLEVMKTLVAHEVMHCIYEHFLRLENRDARKFNMAGDYRINADLLKAGFKKIEGWLYSQEFADSKYTTERIYNILKDMSEPQCGWDFGRVMPRKDKKKTLARKWKTAVKQAGKLCKIKDIGSLPAGILRAIEVSEREFSLEEILREYVSKVVRENYTWQKRSRRYSDIYLPRLESKVVGKIAIVIDTSGSMSSKEIGAAQNALNSVLSEVMANVVYIECDAELQTVKELEPADYPIKLEPKGGGGTDFRPAFYEINKNHDDVMCVIYITDGYGTFPKDSDCDVIWLATEDNFNPPFGHCVNLKDIEI